MTERQQPAPHRTRPGPDVTDAPNNRYERSPTPPPRQQHRMRRTGSPSRPTAATRSGSARALTPTPYRRASDDVADTEEGPAKPLDRPPSYRDDLVLRR